METKSAYQRDHEKAVRAIEVAAEFTPELKAAGAISPATAINLLAYLLAHNVFLHRASQPSLEVVPIDMLLFCPKCGYQHVDASDREDEGWTNPPHKSHLCHACNHIWRPADVHTNGVATISTKGTADSAIVRPDAIKVQDKKTDQMACIHCHSSKIVGRPKCPECGHDRFAQRPLTFPASQPYEPIINLELVDLQEKQP